MNSSVQKSMKTFFWLVRREFWENKAMLFWLPVALGVGFFLMFLAVEISFKQVLSEDGFKEIQAIVGYADATAIRLKSVTHIPSSMARFILHVLLISSALLSSGYLFSALHGDRRDRSVLFWKSMPVSDLSQVLAKLVFPLLLTPVLVIVIGFLSCFLAAFIVAVLSLFGYINWFSTILSNPDLYTLPLTYLSLLPFYMVWALPTVGWFLLVSSMASSRVFPWAVGMPIMLTLILTFLNGILKLNLDIVWVVKNLLARLIIANVPASWVLDLSPPQMALIGPKSLHVIAVDVPWSGASLWLGAVFGIALILIATRVRKHADVLN